MHSKSGENLEEIVLTKGIKEWGNTVGAIQYILACHVSKNSHILDVGCNSGSLVYNLWQLGFHALFGVDIDKSRIERGQSAYPEIKEFLRVYDGSKLPFEDEKFDVITMFDVLEHIENVESFLMDEVSRVLKTNGTLIFQTPNKYTNIPWEIWIHRSFSKYKTYHVSLQSYRGLNRLLQACGFVNIRIQKLDIRNDYYISSLRKYFGYLAYPIVVLANLLPVACATNFWGHCQKCR